MSTGQSIAYGGCADPGVWNAGGAWNFFAHDVVSGFSFGGDPITTNSPIMRGIVPFNVNDEFSVFSSDPKECTILDSPFPLGHPNMGGPLFGTARLGPGQYKQDEPFSGDNSHSVNTEDCAIFVDLRRSEKEVAEERRGFGPPDPAEITGPWAFGTSHASEVIDG